MKEFKIQDLFSEHMFLRIYTLDQTTPKQWPYFDHSHEYMQIWYVRNGKCQHIVESGEYQMEAGSLLMIPPKVVHRIGDISEDVVVIGCDFPMDIILNDTMVSADGKYNMFRMAYVETFEAAIKKVRPQYTPSTSCRVLIEEILEELMLINNEKKRYYEVELKYLLFKLLVTVARDYEYNEEKEGIKEFSYIKDVENAVKYIQENYNERLYVKDVAKVAAMSVSYFSFFFKKYIGKSFISYVNELKIEKAKHYLLNTDMSMDEISDKLGFGDKTSFSRLFKKLTRTSPGKYRLK